MKLFELQNETRRWLDQMKIKNYTINSDGTVDVNSHVNLVDMGLTEIPVQFGKIKGGFNCHKNQLTSLSP